MIFDPDLKRWVVKGVSHLPKFSRPLMSRPKARLLSLQRLLPLPELRPRPPPEQSECPRRIRPRHRAHVLYHPLMPMLSPLAAHRSPAASLLPKYRLRATVDPGRKAQRPWASDVLLWEVRPHEAPQARRSMIYSRGRHLSGRRRRQRKREQGIDTSMSFSKVAMGRKALSYSSIICIERACISRHAGGGRQ